MVRHAPSRRHVPHGVLCVLTQAALGAAARRGVYWGIAAADQGTVSFLLGPNPAHWGNSSLPVSDITKGVVHCCSALVINRTGHLLVAYPDQVKPGAYSPFAAKGVETFVTIAAAEGSFEPGTEAPALGLNCSNPPAAGEENCVTPADLCHAALGRKEAFAAEVLAMTLKHNLSGVSVDWEYGYGNDIKCFAALWAYVRSEIGKHGKQFAPWVDNGGGWASNPGMSDDEWSYCTRRAPRTTDRSPRRAARRCAVPSAAEWPPPSRPTPPSLPRVVP